MSSAVVLGAGLANAGLALHGPAMLAGGSAAAGPLPMIDLNPISWLGDAALAATADVWKAAMIGLWSAGLWLLQLAFKVIDAFTTPDLSAHGPIGAVLPTTLWIGGFVAATMLFVQLTLALIRRDGRSVGRVLLGVAQFGLVWVGYLGVGGGLVAAAAGLSRSILQAMLHVDTLSAFDPASSWPRDVVDTTVATVLGVSSLLLVIPAAFFYLLIMLVREAALIILVVTAPISAGGLVSDSTKTWFWKSLRWFISCLLIAPTAALVLGIGVQLSAGAVAGRGDQTAAAAGMAIIGAVMIAIGAVCPLVLFRLLAFVEPGTASGAALRQSWADAGGLSGVLARGGTRPTGNGAATQSGTDGRSGGEVAAEAQSSSRLASMLGPVVSAVRTGTGLATSVADRAVAIGTDVLGSGGVGHPGYSLTPTDQRSGRGPGAGIPVSSTGGSHSGPAASGSADRNGSAGAPGPDAGDAPSPPPPIPPAPPASAGGLLAWAHDGGSGGSGGSGGAAAAGGTEAAGAVAL